MMKNKILTIYEINLYQIMIFVYRQHNTMLPKVFDNCFANVSHHYPSRFSQYGFLTQADVGRKAKYSIIHRGPHVWNHFKCDEIKSSNSLQSFKRQIKSFPIGLEEGLNIW